MSLTSGTRLGVFQIGELIGRGGMGEVHRATDTRLKRQVAIKVLPQSLAADHDRLARFQREAEVLAALNHHNIAAIYGLEEGEGITALVMELVEGPDLADLIGQGREPGAGGLPVEDVLNIARQIAAALEAAHEQGIIHRDLKPANIKVRADGTVKLLDFGLAKAVTGEGTHAGSADTEDVTLQGTREGVILGTPAYMSPEQARGRALDRRTDIWSFGCVLYEMLSGTAAFHGDTLSDVIVSLLEREPQWAALPRATPTSIRRLLRRCLEKDPRRRLRDIGDAQAELEELAIDPDQAAGVVHAGGGHEIAFRRLTDICGTKESPAISPDGKMVAFVALVGGKRQIWIRLLAGGVPLQVTRDPIDHEQPRWTPDSSTLIYYTPTSRRGEDGTVWEISALGGWPRRIASATAGGDVSRDGQRIALFQSAGEQVALMTVARDGSHGTRVALLPPRQTYLAPRWSPDDHAIAFERSSGAKILVTLQVLSVADGRLHDVAQSEWLKGFCWLPDGSGLVYSSSRGSTLLYPPIFNLRVVTRDGQHDRQLTFGDQSFVEPDTDPLGKLVASRIKGTSDIWKIPVTGSPAQNTAAAVRITRQTGEVRTPSASPDDTEVVYLSDSGGHSNLWVARSDGSSVRQLTFEQDPAVTVGLPKWSPTSDVIAFVESRGGDTGVFVINADGSGLRQVVAGGRGPCWSGDGSWIYYESQGALLIEKVPLDGGPAVVVREERGVVLPAISPDGSTLYFGAMLRSNEFGVGRADIELRRACPESGPGEVMARISGGRIPGLPPVPHAVLSPDGRWLAIPLMDGETTNLWALSTAGGALTPLTDYGTRSIVIARSVSWSADSQFIYAAVSEAQTDVVMLEGLVGGSGHGWSQ